MPLPIPKLDDRRYQDLVTSLRDQIPGFTREWTDFNPSDPGITILELWCWIAEMILYRIDQIPERTYTNFFKLILDPPEPVTTDVTLTIHPQFGDTPILIPPGIRFATMVHSPPECPPEVLQILSNCQLIFETYKPVEVPVIHLGSPPDFTSPPEFDQVAFPVRSKVVIENEELGVSNGKPDQIFYLKSGPVLLDENNISTGGESYNPNPRISVGEEIWEYVPDFLEESTGPESKQYMVEQLTGGVRFGNGDKGTIPLAGATIVAQQYHIILGREVKIWQDMLGEILDDIPELPGTDILEIRNRRAEGGSFIYPREEVWSTGLNLFKQNFRAITLEDFEELAKERFNEAQDSSWVPEAHDNRVARAVAVPGKNLEGNPPFQKEQGAISIIILPKSKDSEDIELVPTGELIGEVERFLDQRRLITTRIHVVGPKYVIISLEIELVLEPRTNASEKEAEIKNQIQEFFHPLTGGDQGTGWPLGRNVYKSELFQLVESVGSIDHVNKVVLNGDPLAKEIPLVEIELPIINNINITL
ncbi:MAG: hypothetical protein GY797_10310 [Deltaproteobacteria bacterium]|nr:hypothetical protein [Deltaproteobacteria bacterium]